MPLLHRIWAMTGQQSTGRPSATPGSAGFSICQTYVGALLVLSLTKGVPHLDCQLSLSSPCQTFLAPGRGWRALQEAHSRCAPLALAKPLPPQAGIDGQGRSASRCASACCVCSTERRAASGQSSVHESKRRSPSCIPKPCRKQIVSISVEL